MKKKFIFNVLWFILSHTYLCEAKNAGILPYTHHQGKLLILLGQELNGDWADFGGKGQTKTEIPQKIAIREFSEETRDAFGKNRDPKTARTASNQYIKSRMSKEILHPRKYYSLYLANVEYLDPATIKKGPGSDREKKDFHWVNAQDFINAIKNAPTEKKAYYNDPIKNKMHIRYQLVTYFLNPKTLNEIEKILGLPTTKPIKSYVLEKEEEEEYEPGWGPAPRREEEEYVPSWGRPPEEETEESSEGEYEAIQQPAYPYLPQYIAYQQQHQYPTTYQYPTQPQLYQLYQYPAHPYTQPYTIPTYTQPMYTYPTQPIQPYYAESEEEEEEEWVPAPTPIITKKSSLKISPLQQNLEKLTQKLLTMKRLLQ